MKTGWPSRWVARMRWPRKGDRARAPARTRSAWSDGSGWPETCCTTTCGAAGPAACLTSIRQWRSSRPLPMASRTADAEIAERAAAFCASRRRRGRGLGRRRGASGSGSRGGGCRVGRRGRRRRRVRRRSAARKRRPSGMWRLVPRMRSSTRCRQERPAAARMTRRTGGGISSSSSIVLSWTAGSKADS